jgi:FkbM family methyltransferase
MNHTDKKSILRLAKERLRLKQRLKNLRYMLHGLPMVSEMEISKDQIRKLVGKDDPLILEIGCNDGLNTQWFLEIFRNPKIYCFEPDPRAITRFKSNIGSHPCVTLAEIALSDREGEITFFQSGGQPSEENSAKMPEGWDLSGSIRPPKEHLESHPWCKFESKIQVRTSTLDSWCDANAIETVDFVWMDVQGAEMDVLRGSSATLRKTRFIYMEYAEKELYAGQALLPDLIRFLKNFRVISRYPSDVLLQNKRPTYTTRA